MKAELLSGEARKAAARLVVENHYARSVPSGKSHYVKVGDVLIVWALPANMHTATVVLGKGARNGSVWELARMWAPDGHTTTCTQAIRVAIKELQRLENPLALVSYADPNAQHNGTVYKAASWALHGITEDQRGWRKDGQFYPRRKFHSGKDFLRKPQIEALGYTQDSLPGKIRFIKLLKRRPTKGSAQRPVAK